MGSARAELLKLRKRPATWVLLGVWLALTLAFGYLIPYLIFRSDPADPLARRVLAEVLPSRVSANAIAGLPLFGGAIALIFGVLLTGSEYGWDTVKTLLVQGPNRVQVYASKLGVLVGAVGVLVGLTYALSAAASATIAALESQPADWAPAWELIRSLGAGWLILSAWATLGLCLGVVSRGTSLAIGLGLVWLLVVENLIRGLSTLSDAFDAVQRALPGVNAGSLAAAVGATQGGEAGAPGVDAVTSGGRAALVLGAYVVAAAALALVVLRRRDVT
ncbi:MAG: ABC transporter permease [Actinomycetota bacterium]|nr:ABC transporter permease [Actinomycetota bacterium]